KR
ncbi:bacterial regulatory helix-turn-helix, lysR family protein, partial [Vibrio parahaemolyticus V-223/04]